MLEDHAAVLVVGPRATGKTTSCEQRARTVIRLGEPEVANAFRAGPASILSDRDEPVLVDEWQDVPASLQAIKIAVDTNPTSGRFIVTGSVRGDIDTPTWPGTGRLVRLAMYGLTEREIEGSLADRSWLAAIIAGEPPGTHRSNEDLRGYVRRHSGQAFPNQR
jgi:predicted AAA+ superfamily ATPase